MMNEVRFTNVIETPYTEEELFNKLCRMYGDIPIKNISSLWFYIESTLINKLRSEIEEADNEDRDNEMEWETYFSIKNSTVDINLLLIKTYAPDIYNSYEYDFDYIKYDEFHDDYELIIYKKLYEPTLKICGDILNLHFKERFDNYINEKDAYLSGDETDRSFGVDSDIDTDTDEY